MNKILVINPGSTSTKIAVYNNTQLEFQQSIRHSLDELQQFDSVIAQFDFRKDLVINVLQRENIDLNTFSIIIGRGGMLRPVQSGVYQVNQSMLDDLKIGQQHASNLGAFIAWSLAEQIAGCRAYIADPVVVDELDDIARISGLPQIPRRSTFHALNHKAVARKYAEKIGKNYENLNLIIAHLGGGISIGAHRYGKVVDVNQGLDGYGAFSPERSGTLDAGDLTKLCFSGNYSQKEILQLLAGRGGLIAHLGTNSVSDIEERATLGDGKSRILLEAMAYNVAKEISALHAVLCGKTDAAILTGGVAYCSIVTDKIKQMIGNFINVEVMPGENEMEALAFAALRVLNGEEAKQY